MRDDDSRGEAVKDHHHARRERPYDLGGELHKELKRFSHAKAQRRNEENCLTLRRCAFA